MNHRVIIVGMSVLIVAAIVGGVVYVEWPRQSTPQAQLSPQESPAVETVQEPTTATSSLVKSLPQLVVGTPAVEAQASMTSASPLIIAVNEPTDITVTISITDSRLIPASVNLQRLDASGKVVAVLGNLNDSGTNGDATANDKTFTIRQKFTEVTTTPVKLQISWALKGVLKRVVSNMITVSTIVLPPDPGAAGKATLQGIDSDGDGIRDDVQRYIVLTYPDSERTRAALTQYTRTEQMAILDASSKEASINHAREEIDANDCLYFIRPNDARTIGDALIAEILNTKARSVAYLRYNEQLGGQVSDDATPKTERKFRCDFNPDTMRN